eukprot:6421726-Amphidinium_carterae.2
MSLGKKTTKQKLSFLRLAAGHGELVDLHLVESTSRRCRNSMAPHSLSRVGKIAKGRYSSGREARACFGSSCSHTACHEAGYTGLLKLGEMSRARV